MFVFGLMAIVFVSRANVNTEPVKEKVQYENKAALSISDSDEVNIDLKICTVTQTAKVSVYFVDYTVSCSATAETCAAAIEQSLQCISAAVSRLKQVMQ